MTFNWKVAGVVISVVISVLGAGVSVWGALQTERSYMLTLDLAEEQRFTSLRYNVRDDCEIAVAPLPEGAQLQYLRLHFGDTNFGVGPISRVEDNLELRPTVLLLFETWQGIRNTSLEESPSQEDLLDCEKYQDCSVYFESFVPILAQYEIESHGKLREYWALMGLRVRQVRSTLAKDEIGCRGFIYLKHYANKTEAVTDSSEEWKRYIRDVSQHSPRAIAGSGQASR